MSTRIQLSLTFACLFGAIIVALAFFSYVVRRHDVYQRLDAELRVAAGATAMSAEHELNEHPTKPAGERDLQSVLDESKSFALADTEIVVCDGRREAAHKFGVSGGIDLCKAGVDSSTGKADAGRLKVATADVSVPKFGTTYVVYAAKPIGPFLRQLDRLRVSLIVIVPLGLVIAAVAGYLLAARSLQPLRELARTVDEVSASDLSARVCVSNGGGELGMLVRRFNSLLGRLEQAFSFQRRFMADASHQIRTPVTVALAAAQVISRASSPNVQECGDSLQVIEKQMLQLRRIVEDMFFLSQADSAALAIKREEMYLDDAVIEAVQSAIPLASAREQDLSLSKLPEALCLGDKQLLAQAILILLDNAVKYTPLRGAIEVRLSEREGYWLCSIIDNGPGISEAAQPRIFERFFQERKSGAQALGGAGLGLPIAKSIVESHSGTITLVASEPDGTTFEIAIPVFCRSTPPEEAYANPLAVRI
jgi:signal transduction histidine kinase